MRKRKGRVRTGWDGRGSSGAGLGLNAPLRFGVLMENCSRARPTAATVAARPHQTMERGKSSKKAEPKESWMVISVKQSPDNIEE